MCVVSIELAALLDSHSFSLLSLCAGGKEGHRKKSSWRGTGGDGESGGGLLSRPHVVRRGRRRRRWYASPAASVKEASFKWKAGGRRMFSAAYWFSCRPTSHGSEVE
ncbi:hypothetical protein GW17_00029360 [Ensete ventricosum]|nr:hypothetical protein GW17_00029360 [Ensete ventricosum]RZS19787.1 hypothetical protein BHM03_00052227 [Ensete ventricosum]